MEDKKPRKSKMRRMLSVFLRSESNITRRTLTVFVLGGECTGKSSLINVLCGEEFSDAYSPTSFDLFEKEILIGNSQVKYTFFDVSGKYGFTAMRRLYINKADIFFMVYSADVADSYKQMLLYKREIEETKDERISELSVAVIKTKCDSIQELEKRTKPEHQISNWCTSIFHCSAKFGFNVSKLTEFLIAESFTNTIDKKLNKGLSGRYIYGGDEALSRSISLIEPKNHLGEEFEEKT